MQPAVKALYWFAPQRRPRTTASVTHAASQRKVRRGCEVLLRQQSSQIQCRLCPHSGLTHFTDERQLFAVFLQFTHISGVTAILWVSSLPARTHSCLHGRANPRTPTCDICLGNDLPIARGRHALWEGQRWKIAATQNRLGSHKCRGRRPRRGCTHHHVVKSSARHIGRRIRGWTERS